MNYIDPSKYDVHKAAGIIIVDRKILVERSKGEEHYKAPGGRIELGETAKQGLTRELREEFGIQINEEDLKEFWIFCHNAAGEGTKTLCMEVYMVNKWMGEITPNNEVEEIKWLTSQIPEDITVGSVIAEEVIPRLREKYLID